jgi:hypothetical protein
MPCATLRSSSIAVLCSAGLLLMPVAAHAGSLAAPWATVTPIYTNTAIGLLMIDSARQAQRIAEGQPGHAPPGSGGGAAAPRQASFDIGSDTAVSARVKAQYLNSLRGANDAQTVASIATTFEQLPVRRAYLEAAGPYRLSDRDLRDVATAYLVTAWMTANRAPLPSLAQVQAVRRQFGASLESHPPAGDAAQRQAVAEQMMYELVSMIYARQDGERAHNAQSLARLADLTDAGFRSQHIELRALTLTERGFAKR